MCGIVGILNFDNSYLDFRQFLQMTESLIHRGPDHTGTVFFSLSKGHILETRGTNAFETPSKIGFRFLTITLSTWQDEYPPDT